MRRKLDNEIYALKKVRIIGMKDKERDNALNEIRILASLDDDHIVKFKEAFYDNSSGCLLYTSPSPRDLSTSRMPSSA